MNALDAGPLPANDGAAATGRWRGGSGTGRPGGRQRPAWLNWLISAAAVVYKAKFLLLFLSIFVSLLVYDWAFGWWFAVGLIGILGLHELGHALAIRRRGLAASLPVFVPLMGAVIGLRQRPRDAAEEAYIAIAGPVFGLAASIGCWVLLDVSHAPVFAALAVTGFYIHLFNLLPVAPLDGGRTVAFMRAKAWIPGFLALLVAIFYNPFAGRFVFDPVALVVLVFVGSQLYSRLRRPYPASYDAIGPAARWGYGALWLGLLVLSLAGTLVVSLRA